MSARDDVLARIRAAVAAVAPPRPGVSGGARGAERPVGSEQASVSYRERGQLATPAVLDLLADRLADYQAVVRRAATATRAANTAAALAQRGAPPVVGPARLPPPAPPRADATVRERLAPGRVGV